MIQYIKGNILESAAAALVNTVNLVGIMGKGIALQFKTQFPTNYKLYKQACAEKRINIGKLFVTKENTVWGDKLIINFPTKTDWRKPSEYAYIEAGLDDLLRIISEYNITSIAIPPLGAGNGGLNWEKVKQIIDSKLGSLNIDIYVYEPNAVIVEKMKKERVKLTNARALLLYVLFDLVRQGEDVSEFSSEKICYFLQKFGAADLFKLQYEPKYYGPYSGKVRYVLQALNGSYIMGYSDMDKKPFEPISLVADTYQEIENIIVSDPKLSSIATKTTQFLNGYYSNIALELLSSVDYLVFYQNCTTEESVFQVLMSWNHRKSQLFSNEEYVTKAYNYIMSYKENLADEKETI